MFVIIRNRSVEKIVIIPGGDWADLNILGVDKSYEAYVFYGISNIRMSQNEKKVQYYNKYLSYEYINICDRHFSLYFMENESIYEDSFEYDCVHGINL